MRWLVVDSAIGELSVATDDTAVSGLQFGRLASAEPVDRPPDGALGVAITELAAYFAGHLTRFTVPVTIGRGSAFEHAVWTELSRIPYGQTRTYGEIAAAVGDSGAARAVGTACNRNPIPVIIPCHRVVGAGGKLVGFGGGLPRKRQLLELEARVEFQRVWGVSDG